MPRVPAASGRLGASTPSHCFSCFCSFSCPSLYLYHKRLSRALANVLCLVWRGQRPNEKAQGNFAQPASSWRPPPIAPTSRGSPRSTRTMFRSPCVRLGRGPRPRQPRERPPARGASGSPRKLARVCARARGSDDTDLLTDLVVLIRSKLRPIRHAQIQF